MIKRLLLAANVAAGLLGPSACKSTQFNSGNYKTGKDRDAGAKKKEDMLQNSAFTKPEGGSADQTAKKKKKDPNGTKDPKANTDAAGKRQDPKATDLGSGSGGDTDLGSGRPQEPQIDINPNAPPSGIPILRICSNARTESAGTNLKASAGAVASLIRVGAPPVAGKDPNVHFHDGAIASALKNDILNVGALTLPLGNVPGGQYTLLVCAAEAAASCKNPPQTVAAIGGVGEPWGLAPGLLASGNLTIQSGVATALTSTSFGDGKRLVVLTDQNKEQEAVFNAFGNLFSQAVAADTGQPAPQTPGLPEGIEDCDENASPLILDLANEGIELAPPYPGVAFDVDAFGKVEHVSWPLLPTSMFLALDLNQNGRIDDGTELFGDHSAAPDGARPPNGFEALAKHDANKDLVIDAKDPIFDRLVLWSDNNRDGRTDPGELLTLASQEVESIDLLYTTGLEKDAYGNQTRQRSVFKLKSGLMRLVVDVWFRKL